MTNLKKIKGTPFDYYENLDGRLLDLHSRVQEMRRVGKLSPQVLGRIQKYFRIKDIYHSNAIEGNALTIGETKWVVEEGILTGKAPRDQAEAKNLSHALDFMENIASSTEKPITLSDLRQIHALILKGIQDEYAGKYRRNEVKISGSDYKPTEAYLISQQMDELGAYVQSVTSPDSPDADLPILCAAAAAHAWLAQIHPFIDGNGRTARILMNLILMRRGYPICIITRDDRLRYYDALEESQAGDLSPLIELVYENVEESLEEWEKAAKEQREKQEWLEDITTRLEGPALRQARNEYEVWRLGMELFKSYFKKIVDDMNERRTVGSGWLNFKDYGTLSFEKYLSLRDGRSAKKTWFFGIEFRQGGRRARYLFFFGYSVHRLRQRVPVVLILAKDTDYGGYVQLRNINQSNKPDMVQVGFDMKKQAFVALTISGVQEGKVENFAKKFFDQAVQWDF